MRMRTKMRKTIYPKQKQPISETHPELAKEWHHTKNGGLLPTNLNYSSKKIWWKCLKNKKHEWEASILDRIGNIKIGRKGTNCPYCSNQRVCEDNCLATISPELAKEWHLTKNEKLTPSDVLNSSRKSVWWICKKNHEWKAVVRNRSTKIKTGCPYCSNQKACKDNCLSTKNPELIKLWHPTKNGSLTPNDVLPKSAKKCWWICEKGHEHLSKISDKTIGYGCPYCSGDRVCKDNCLETLFPEIAKLWHPSKNGNLTPNDVTTGSGRKIWWKCSKGHEWEAVIGSVCSRSGCPYCNKIELKDGAILSSIPEAIKYLEYKRGGFLFKYDKIYHKNLGKRRYDFYFPLENKYVEITSFNKNTTSLMPGGYFKYLRNIVKKKLFVKNILNAKFEFVQFTPSKEQIKMVKENIL